MSEQGHLFGPRRPAWVAEIWDRCDAGVRRECIAILAEMGRATLAPKRAGRKRARRQSAEESGLSRREVKDEC